MSTFPVIRGERTIDIAGLAIGLCLGAMAYWLLGRYGEGDDHSRVISQFGRETNSFVLAELALASQRLAPQK